MGMYTLTDGIIRVVVALAAWLIISPMLGRGGRGGTSRVWLTRGIFIAGITMVLLPAVLPTIWGAVGLRRDLAYSILGRADAPGFALILFGLLRGIQQMRTSRDQLVEQNKELREQASTDFLTGLLNRREADQLLEYGSSRARHSDYPVGFIMIDLDHFKRINDTYGHPAGDAVLAHLGGILKNHLRSSDIVARYGGEEFLVVVAEPRREAILALAEVLRSLIERNPTEVNGHRLKVTASFGVAVSHVSTERAAREAVGKADAALYAAKGKGRNCVVTWEEASANGTAPALRLADHREVKSA